MKLYRFKGCLHTYSLGRITALKDYPANRNKEIEEFVVVRINNIKGFA